VQIFCDVNLRRLVASPVDGKTLTSITLVAGNVVPIALQFVDTTTGNIINFGSHTLSIGLGGWQAPVIPVLAIAPNHLPVWNFLLNLRRSGIANAETLQVFTNDGRYKTTWAQQTVTIVNPPLPWVVDSSSSSTAVSVSSSSSTAASLSSSSSTAVSLSSSSSSTAASLSSSSSAGHALFGGDFNNATQYNDFYLVVGTHDGRRLYQGLEFGNYIYWNEPAQWWLMNPTVLADGFNGDYRLNSNVQTPVGTYTPQNGPAPGGTISE